MPTRHHMLSTPLKFNMEPGKGEIPFGNHHFSGAVLNFGGVSSIYGFLNGVLFNGSCRPGRQGDQVI